MTMIIKVETVTGKDLQPGDLFSVVDEEWWGSVNDRDMDPAPVGERVYIRTNAPCPKDQVDDELVRLTIEQVSDHASYHCDVGPDDEGGNPGVEVSPNPDCPYCKGELVEDTDPVEEDKSDSEGLGLPFGPEDPDARIN